jgi:hypothetical protein
LLNVFICRIKVFVTMPSSVKGVYPVCDLSQGGAFDRGRRG